jgi:hypothetical protein
MNQYCITNVKAGGWIYRWDDFSITGYSKISLAGGNVFSVTTKNKNNDSWHTCFPIIPSGFSKHITINHGKGYDEYGTSLAIKNIYIVSSDNLSNDFSPNNYFTGLILEHGDIFTISKNSFDGDGMFGVILENSHRIMLQKSGFNNQIGFKIMRETYLNTVEEGKIPSFMVEFTSY